MHRFGIAVLAAFAFAGPAQAADPGTIGCALGRLKPAVRAQIVADSVRNLGSDVDRPTFDATALRGIAAAVDECALQNNWSRAAVQAAREYTLAAVALPVAKRAVMEHGFDPDRLEAQLEALPEETRDSPLSPQDIQQLVIASVPDQAKQTRENALLLKKFFYYLQPMRLAASRFSQL